MSDEGFCGAVGAVRLVPGNEAAKSLSFARGQVVTRALLVYFKSSEPARTRLYTYEKGFEVSALDDRWFDWSGVEHMK